MHFKNTIELKDAVFLCQNIISLRRIILNGPNASCNTGKKKCMKFYFQYNNIRNHHFQSL